jgi:hypothetical protein
MVSTAVAARIMARLNGGCPFGCVAVARLEVASMGGKVDLGRYALRIGAATANPQPHAGPGSTDRAMAYPERPRSRGDRGCLDASSASEDWVWALATAWCW